MSTEGNTTNGPHTATTLPVADDSMVVDRWRGATLGKYRIVRRLGTGGTGVVYEAVDPILDRPVALKMLRDSIADRPDSFRKFLKEARTAAKLNHPHVVAVYEADEAKGVGYLVMELMEGGSAHHRIDKFGPFGWVEGTQVIMDACRGLAAIHAAGLIHRDIKPSNIMRAADGTVKVTDFGLAHAIETISESKLPYGQVVGTPLYMSPEQCQGKKIDHRTDIYALGATYFTLLTGRAPFEGSSPLQIMEGHCTRPIPDVCEGNSDIPAACRNLIRRAMAKNPKDRPADAAALLKDFEAILALATSPDLPPIDWKSVPDRIDAGASTAVEPITPMVLRPANEIARTRIWFVVACLILIGFAFWLGWKSSRNPNPPGNDLAKEGEKPQIETDPRDRKNIAVPGVTIIEAGGPVNSVAFDPRNTTRVAWGTSNGEHKINFWPDDRALHVISKASAIGKSIRQVCYWQTDKDCELIRLHEGRLHFFHADSYEAIERAANVTSVSEKKIRSFAHIANRRMLALAVKDDSSPQGGILLRVLAGEQPRNAFIQMENMLPPECVALSRDGQWLLGSNDRGVVKIWKIAGSDGTSELKVAYAGNTEVGKGPIVTLAGMNGSRFAVAVGTQGWFFDAATGSKFDKSGNQTVGDPAPFHQGTHSVTALAVCPNARKVACGAGDTVFLYEVAGGKLIGEYKLPTTEVRTLAFNGDSSHLAVGGADGKIAIRLLKD